MGVGRWFSDVLQTSKQLALFRARILISLKGSDRIAGCQYFNASTRDNLEGKTPK
jgi:hypothetical protein